LRWSVVPFFLSAIIFVVGLSFVPGLSGLLHAGLEKSEILKSVGGFAGQILFWVTLVVAWTTGLVALLYILFLFTRLVAAPFYSILAEKTLVELSVIKEERFRLVPWLALTTKMFTVSLIRAIVFGIIGALLLLLSFIPGLGIATGIGFLMLAAYDVADYALEAMQLGFRDRIGFFRRHLIAFFGFGLVMGLVFLIPGLNFFLLPASVVGACDMVRRLKGPVRLENPGVSEDPVRQS
jgi:CysZ protein